MRHYFLASFALIAAFVAIVAGATSAPTNSMPIAVDAPEEIAPLPLVKAEPSFCWLEEPIADPLPMTEYVEEPTFPNAKQLRLIGRIAEGIYKNRTRKGNAPYWFCGEPYRDEEAKDLAMTVAYHVVRSAWEASDDRRTINAWGWAGLLLNEGGMDLCTLGLNPRKAAYQLGVLKPRKLTVSHTKEEVLSAINHDSMKKLFRTYDLGMGQTLDLHYRAWLKDERRQGEPADLIEWKGFYWQAIYLHDLAVSYDTDRPWLYWPGYRAPWKDARVTRHARALGATPEDIGPITPGDWKKPTTRMVRGYAERTR